jgi:hypothetical protein
VNRAMEEVLKSGTVTADLKPAGKPASTSEVGDAVCARVQEQASEQVYGKTERRGQEATHHY